MIATLRFLFTAVLLTVAATAVTFAQGTVNARPLKIYSSSTPLNNITIQGPTTYTSTYTLTMPGVGPAVNQLLLSDGSGVLSWGLITNSNIGDTTITLPKLSIAGATSGQVITFNGTNIAWVTPSGGLTNFKDTLYVSAPNNVRNIAALTAIGTATDIDIALTPKGNGALTAQPANDSSTGGNKRGQYAVDWQMVRGSITDEDQVASGVYAVISGGYGNRASDSAAVVSGGYHNFVDAQYSSIAGGEGNAVNADYSAVGGGKTNAATGMYSVVTGGESNLAASHYSFIGSGEDNTAGGDFSAIPGGQGLTMFGERNFGFHANTTAGDRNMVLGVGTTNTAVLGNVDLWLASNDGTNRQLRFYSTYNTAGTFPSTAKYSGFVAPNTLTSNKNIIYALPTAQPLTGQFLRAVNLVTDSVNTTVDLDWENGSGALQYFTESQDTTVNINNPFFVSALKAAGTSDDIDIALMPKGDGSLLAQIPDTTALGGDKRGEYSVDWQMNRLDRTQVASGHCSVIAGGIDNMATGSNSVISGGWNNSANGVLSTVGGGYQNIADFTATTVSGGSNNTAIGYGATISGGFFNLADTNANYAALAGGFGNTAMAIYGTIPGGAGLTLNGTRSFGFHANRSNGSFDGNDRNMSVSDSNTAIFGNVNLWLASNDGTNRALRFYAAHNASGAFPDSTKYTGFVAPNTLPANNNVVYTLPGTEPTAGQFLRAINVNSGGGGGTTTADLEWATVSAITALTGDVTASGSGSVSASVVRIQGNNVSSAAPNNGDVLAWNGTTSTWEPTNAMPCGSIVMWTGASVPSGWALCDGSSSTPDLRGQFLMGATVIGDVGNTGGSPSHSHTVDSHTHSIPALLGSGSNGTASFTGTTGSNTTGITASVQSGGTEIQSGSGYSSAVDITDNGHDHSLNINITDVDVSITTSADNTGSASPGTDSQSNLPPYYVVAYIMRVCP